MFTHTQAFYNRSLRNTVIAFGSIFESLYISRYEEDGVTEKEQIRVPLEYGNKEKFVQTLSKDTTGRVQITLPKMSFEITNILYDPTRKVNRMNRRAGYVDDVYKNMFAEVPYNVGFGLYIYTRHMDDMLQIVEQIIPYFAPDYTISVKMNDLHDSVDIPFVLNGVNINEDYEGPLDTRRSLVGVLDFTAKTYIYPKICGGPGGVILRSDIDIYNGVTGQVYQSDIGYTGDLDTGSITKVTGDWSRP
jgi:hypothetical protein